MVFSFGISVGFRHFDDRPSESRAGGGDKKALRGIDAYDFKRHRAEWMRLPRPIFLIRHTVGTP